MSVPASKKETTPLLWTGGWDSTFRLLQLLLLERRAVQPYHLIDADRASVGAEMKAMKDIKTRLFHEHPHTRGLLHRVEYVEVSDIEPDAGVAEAFRTVLARRPIGSQYDWIARFCKQHGMQDIELCVHRDDKAHAVLEPFVLEHCSNGYKTYRLDVTRAPREECTLFRYFQFPVFHLSKLEMAAAARERDWNGFMNMTWFCHHPTVRHQPCGKCSPCLDAMEEGMGWRIPLTRRMAFRLRRAIFRPLHRAAGVLTQGLPGRPRTPRIS